MIITKLNAFPTRILSTSGSSNNNEQKTPSHKNKQDNLNLRWEYSTTRADYSINVRPHPIMVGKALADYVAKVTIIEINKIIKTILLSCQSTTVINETRCLKRSYLSSTID